VSKGDLSNDKMLCVFNISSKADFNLCNSKLIMNIIFHVTVHRRFPSTETDGKTRHLGMFKNREGRIQHNVENKTEIRNSGDMAHPSAVHY